MHPSITPEFKEALDAQLDRFKKLLAATIPRSNERLVLANVVSNMASTIYCMQHYEDSPKEKSDG